MEKQRRVLRTKAVAMRSTKGRDCHPPSGRRSYRREGPARPSVHRVSSGGGRRSRSGPRLGISEPIVPLNSDRVLLIYLSTHGFVTFVEGHDGGPDNSSGKLVKIGASVTPPGGNGERTRIATLNQHVVGIVVKPDSKSSVGRVQPHSRKPKLTVDVSPESIRADDGLRTVIERVKHALRPIEALIVEIGARSPVSDGKGGSEIAEIFSQLKLRLDAYAGSLPGFAVDRFGVGYAAAPPLTAAPPCYWKIVQQVGLPNPGEVKLHCAIEIVECQSNRPASLR